MNTQVEVEDIIEEDSWDEVVQEVEDTVNLEDMVCYNS